MNRSLLVGLAAIVVLGLGLWAAARRFTPRRETAPPPPAAAELADPGDDMVARAMRNAPAVPAAVDSAEIKSRWQDEVRGAELSGLDGRQREWFLRFANAARCTCGCGYTLAGCKASDMSCEVSGARIDALLDSIRTGKIHSAKGIRGRPTRGG